MKYKTLVVNLTLILLGKYSGDILAFLTPIEVKETGSSHCAFIEVDGVRQQTCTHKSNHSYCYMGYRSFVASLNAGKTAIGQTYNFVKLNFVKWMWQILNALFACFYYMFVRLLEYKMCIGLITFFDVVQDSLYGFPVQRTRIVGQLIPLASNGWTRWFNPFYYQHIHSISDISVKATGNSFDENGVNKHNAALTAHLQKAIEPIMHNGKALIPVKLNGQNTFQPFTQCSEYKSPFEQALAEIARKGAAGDLLIIRGSADLGVPKQLRMVKEESPCLGSTMMAVPDLGNVPLNQGAIGMEDSDGAMLDLGQYFRVGPLLIMTGHTLQVCVNEVKSNNTKLYFQAIAERGPQGSGQWVSVDRVVGNPISKHGILAPGFSALSTCEGTTIAYDDARRKPFCIGGNNHSVFPYGTHGGDIAVLFPTEYVLENKKLSYDSKKLEQVYGMIGCKKGKLVSDIKAGNVVIHSYCPAPMSPCSTPSSVLCRASGPFDFNGLTILDREVNFSRKRKDLKPIDSLLRSHGCSTISHKGIGEGTSGAMGSVIGNGGTLDGPVLMQTGSYVGPQRDALGGMTNLCVPLYPPMKIIEDQTGLTLINRNRSPAIQELMSSVPFIGNLIENKRRKIAVQLESPNGNRQTEYAHQRENRWELEEDDRQRRESEDEDAADEWAAQLDLIGQHFEMRGDHYRELHPDEFMSRAERCQLAYESLMDDIARKGGQEEGDYEDYGDFMAAARDQMREEDAAYARGGKRARWADLESPRALELIESLDKKGSLDLNKIKDIEDSILAKFDKRSLDLKQDLLATMLHMIQLVKQTLENYKSQPLKLITDGPMANYSGISSGILKALATMDVEDASHIIDLHRNAQLPHKWDDVKTETPNLLDGVYRPADEVEPGFRQAATKGSVANANGAEMGKHKRVRRRKKTLTPEATEESLLTLD